MQQHLHEFLISTARRGMVDFTGEVVSWVASCGVREGLLTLHVLHTSASLLIQENADPAVQSDMERFLERLVPDGDAIYRHTAEGPDDMSSHVRSALTATSLSIPVQAGRPTLGTWQGIYLYEHRVTPHRRRVAAHLLGE
jgi:secondary thiamine-phosphate synthase enzyme